LSNIAIRRGDRWQVKHDVEMWAEITSDTICINNTCSRWRDRYFRLRIEAKDDPELVNHLSHESIHIVLGRRCNYETSLAFDRIEVEGIRVAASGITLPRDWYHDLISREGKSIVCECGSERNCPEAQYLRRPAD
jgi:hypothetical protein